VKARSAAIPFHFFDQPPFSTSAAGLEKRNWGKTKLGTENEIGDRTIFFKKNENRGVGFDRRHRKPGENCPAKKSTRREGYFGVHGDCVAGQRRDCVLSCLPMTAGKFSIAEPINYLNHKNSAPCLWIT
jgi:hypothetical protein